jgi:hypothetical protein
MIPCGNCAFGLKHELRAIFQPQKRAKRIKWENEQLIDVSFIGLKAKKSVEAFCAKCIIQGLFGIPVIVFLLLRWSAF